MKKSFAFIGALGFAGLAFADPSPTYMYDKGDLHVYFTVGADYRFANAKHIQGTVLSPYYFTSPDTSVFIKNGAAYQPTATPSALLISGHSAFTKGSWGVFGESDVVNLPGISLETGANLGQWQFGIGFSHSFFMTSERPQSSIDANFTGFYGDTTGVPVPSQRFALYDAGFSMTDYSLAAGYRLYSQDSYLNLTPRVFAGLTQVDVRFPGAWFVEYLGGGVSEAMKPYMIEDKEYSAVGWHAGVELVPSIKFGKYELSGALGYRFDTYDAFQMTHEKEVTYIYGEDDRNLDNYYASVRLSYVLPSLNELKPK